MSQNVVYVGIDVDDVQYHGSALDRDLLRSRQRLIQQQGDLRRHVLSLLRRNGLHYKAECDRKTHWRTHHYGWLEFTTVEQERETPAPAEQETPAAGG